MTTVNIRVAGMIEFPIYCLGIEGVLKRLPGIDFVGNSALRNLMKFLKDHSADLLLVNTREKTIFNKRLYESIITSFSDMKIVFFINSAAEEEIRQYSGFKLNGLLLKSIGVKELQYAIHAVQTKGFYISQGIPDELIGSFFEKELELPDQNIHLLSKRRFRS